MNTLMIILCLLISGSAQEKITADLNDQINNTAPDQLISCFVFIQQDYPLELMQNASIHDRIQNYQAIAKQSQQALVDWLKTMPDKAQNIQQYWIMNCIYVEATAQIIDQIARRSDVDWLSHNGEVHIIEPEHESAVDSRATPWGIRKIKADSCWAAGFTGEGVILGMCDTGVDYTHPALDGKWSGYWLDVINGQPLPYDDMTGTWHGTHCMGTIMGGDGLGPFAEDIGVAPGARFVAAKMLNSGGSGTYQQCLLGLQFMADLKDSVDIRAVSNSWGGSNGADTFFYPLMRNYISIGIIPVFANGNSGPNPNTVGCPGSYSNNIGVGATDSTDAIASFSSRGPAPNQVPFNDPSTWLRPDWNLIKPQISAPGVSVRSAKGDGSGTYHNLNGTSMATPHVCGALGLLCQKNPNLPIDVMYDILLDYSDQPSGGGPYPNNNFGWGRLNVWRALNGTPSPNYPYMQLATKIINDAGGNGQVNPGETINLGMYAKNIGQGTAQSVYGLLSSSDGYVSSISIDSSWYGNIPYNDSSLSSPYYRFIVTSNCPDAHKLGFVLELHDHNDTIWVRDFTITVAAQAFVHQSSQVVGGNGNGILDPGETAGLVLTIRNSGSANASNVSAILIKRDNFITIGDDSTYLGNINAGNQASNSSDPYGVSAHALTPQGHNALFDLVLKGNGPSAAFTDTISFILLVGTAPPPYAIFEDDFEYGGGIDSLLIYWNRTGNWNWSTSQAHSPTHSAYSGTLVDGTVNFELRTAVSLVGIANPQLKFWDRWAWDNGFWTDAWVEVSTNGGTNWTAIWTLPTNPPNTQNWTEKTYSLNSYVSSNFKVRYRLFSRDFFQNFNDWWMDDFEITAPNDNEPPYFTNTTDWPDTTFTGPFPVQSTITDLNGIDSAYLYYRINSGSWTRLVMSNLGGNLYQATIPSQATGSNVHYYLWARDRWISPNSGCDPVGAPADGYYSFRIGPVGIHEYRLAAIQFMPLTPNPTSRDVQIRFMIHDTRYPINNFSLKVYDAAGRMVRDLSDNLESCIMNHESVLSWNRTDDRERVVPAGVYFIHFEVDQGNQFEKIEKIVLVK